MTAEYIGRGYQPKSTKIKDGFIHELLEYLLAPDLLKVKLLI